MLAEFAGITGAFVGMAAGLAAYLAMGPGGLVAMGIVWAAFSSPSWRMR